MCSDIIIIVKNELFQKTNAKFLPAKMQTTPPRILASDLIKTSAFLPYVATIKILNLCKMHFFNFLGTLLNNGKKGQMVLLSLDREVNF